MKKFAVILSGCGVNDGTEIHEAVVTLLAVVRGGNQYQCFAPNKPQLHVIDHIKGAPVEGESRNVMTEAARIARGEIKDIKDYNPAEFDGLLIPGGFGAAKNLFNYAVKGRDCSIDASVKNAILKTNEIGKPIGAMCISPVLLAKAFEGSGKTITVTIGDGQSLIDDIEAMGAKHQKSPVNKAVVDNANKIVTAPAYITAQNIAEAASGIEDMVDKVAKMV